MKVIDSKIKNLIEKVHTSKYGNYYFFKDFIVSEIKEGVIYNWEAAQDAIKAAKIHYGPSPNICYISNRVNEYSVNPIDWYKFFSSKNELNGYAIVSYTDNGWINAQIERFFFKNRIERFKNLDEAILWSKMTNEKSTIKNNISL